MAKLEIDLDQLQITINDYNKSIEEFDKMILDLDNAIEKLKASGWVSGASTQYFSTYKDIWKANMNMHSKILTQLQDCLAQAKPDYESLYDTIPSLGTDL